MSSRPPRTEPTKIEAYYQAVSILFHELLLRLVPAVMLVVVIRLGSGLLEKVGVESVDFLLALLITTLTANGISDVSPSREDRR